MPDGFEREYLDRAISHGAGHYQDKPLEHYGGKSFKEFLEDIDTVVAETGISLETISRLQARWTVGGDSAQHELIRLCIPVYRRLREMGYAAEALQG